MRRGSRPTACSPRFRRVRAAPPSRITRRLPAKETQILRSAVVCSVGLLRFRRFARLFGGAARGQRHAPRAGAHRLRRPGHQDLSRAAGGRTFRQRNARAAPPGDARLPVRAAPAWKATAMPCASSPPTAAAASNTSTPTAPAKSSPNSSPTGCATTTPRRATSPTTSARAVFCVIDFEFATILAPGAGRSRRRPARTCRCRQLPMQSHSTRTLPARSAPAMVRPHGPRQGARQQRGQFPVSAFRRAGSPLPRKARRRLHGERRSRVRGQRRDGRERWRGSSPAGSRWRKSRACCPARSGNRPSVWRRGTPTCWRNSSIRSTVRCSFLAAATRNAPTWVPL